MLFPPHPKTLPRVFSSPRHQRKLSRDVAAKSRPQNPTRVQGHPCPLCHHWVYGCRGTGTVPSLPGYLGQVPALSRQQDELLMNEMAKANMLSPGNRFLPLVCSGLSQHQGQQLFPAASSSRGGRILLCCLFILLLLLSKYLPGRGRIPFPAYLFLQVN